MRTEKGLLPSSGEQYADASFFKSIRIRPQVTLIAVSWYMRRLQKPRLINYNLDSTFDYRVEHC